MATIGVHGWQSLRVQADLSTLPQTIDLSPSRAGAIMLILFGAGWTVFTLKLVSEADGAEGVAFAFTLLFPLVGLGMVLGGLATLYRRRKATFNGDGVEVEGRKLTGSESWYEPYGAYKGVLHRQKVVKRKNRSTTYQIVELLHDDPDKCVPLYVKPTSKVPRAEWEAYAERLKLPALEESSSGLAARDHEDLDKSLKQLVDEGKVAHAFDPQAAVPAGLDVTHEGEDAMTIVITAPRYPLWFLMIFILAGLGMAIGAFVSDESKAVLLGAGLLFAGLPGFMLYRDRTTYRELRLDRRRLTQTDALGSSRRSRGGLSLDEIESITLRGAQGNLGKELVIASDRGPMHVGGGLSDDALNWLKDFLTAAIATA